MSPVLPPSPASLPHSFPCQSDPLDVCSFLYPLLHSGGRHNNPCSLPRLQTSHKRYIRGLHSQARWIPCFSSSSVLFRLHQGAGIAKRSKGKDALDRIEVVDSANIFPRSNTQRTVLHLNFCTAQALEL